MSRTGAELLIESLISAGVKHLFSLSGNQILSLYDAIIGRDINLIHTRHEAAAVHMADGWGRLTEQPGVALLTAGPGHCNAISALYGALMAESPVVLLSGHSPHAQIGSGAFQEIDQVATAKPVTKAAWLVEDANRLDEAIATALSIACEGRPGPVHLSLPSDVLEATLSPQPLHRTDKDNGVYCTKSAAQAPVGRGGGGGGG
ncbi:thiamine pyrophosphate-binding protein, partial [Candidatus Poribacteria bacterium]|nr:thiamine pyrophosphate-binding protein [Candidatus Poribacteria bacterium]